MRTLSEPLFLGDGLSGDLERPLMATSWSRPFTLTIDRRFLHWQAYLFDEPGHPRVSPGRGMLEQFARLENAPPTEIARFARRWGILNVARFKPSGSAKKRFYWRDPFFLDHVGYKDGAPFAYGREPLYVWGYWISRFAAALRCASEIQEKRHPPSKDWELITGTPDMSHYDPGRDKAAIAYHRSQAKLIDEFPRKHPVEQIPVELPGMPRELALYNVWRFCQEDEFHGFGGEIQARVECFRIISDWQEIAGIELRLNPSSNRIEVATRCLFAGLVWQLMAAVCSCGGVAVCSECSKIYVPNRKPSAKTRNYCPACRKSGAGVKNAVRAFRARQKENDSAETQTR